MSTLATHQQRVVAELAELTGRITRLAAFIDGDVFPGLGALERVDLQLQLQLMRRLEAVLARRVARFG